jgi:predicted nucleic acid-binding protein
VTIVDTSVWIDHLRSGNETLKELLAAESVLMHPFVVGELACGLRGRARILAALNALPAALLASQADVLGLVDRRRLWGKGIGWIDAHLLASALLSNSTVWSFDKPLARAAQSLGIVSSK